MSFPLTSRIALRFGLLSLVGGLSAAAWAQQDPTPPTPTTPPVLTSPGTLSTPTSLPTPPLMYQFTTPEIIVGKPFTATFNQSAPELSKKIKVDIKSTDPINALRQLGKAADLEVDVDKDLSSDARIALKGKDIVLSDALNTIANLGGVAWRYEKRKGGQGVIHITRTAASYRTMIRMTQPPASFNADALEYQIRAMVNNRIASADSLFNATGNSRATLPGTLVKIDVRDADVRDTLKTILNQANLPYALEDDVPTGEKHSFTFENVPVSMALDIITTSIGVGWRADNGTTTGARRTPGASLAQPPLVRIGKKYAGNTYRASTRRVSGRGTIAPATPVPPVPAPATQP